jgi:hypothetical protein
MNFGVAQQAVPYPAQSSLGLIWEAADSDEARMA